MRRMKWTKVCRLGIDLIDSQHRLLFAIANEMLDFENLDTEASEFKYLFDHLRGYIKEHFTHEEQFLKEIDYPDRDNHLAKHSQIIQDMNATLSSAQDFIGLKESLENLLSAWIKQHILVVDRDYAEWYHLRKSRSDKPDR